MLLTDACTGELGLELGPAVALPGSVFALDIAVTLERILCVGELVRVRSRSVRPTTDRDPRSLWGAVLELTVDESPTTDPACTVVKDDMDVAWCSPAVGFGRVGDGSSLLLGTCSPRVRTRGVTGAEFVGGARGVRVPETVTLEVGLEEMPVGALEEEMVARTRDAGRLVGELGRVLPVVFRKKGQDDHEYVLDVYNK